MARKHGKVKAVPITEVSEGMQVLTNLGIGIVMPETKSIDGYYRIGVIGIGIREYKIAGLKTLVIEYEADNSLPNWQEYKQIPLKHSQWKSAINNGEVDSDKIVEFEIIKKVYSTTCEDEEGDFQYAKIIPQKKLGKIS